MAYPLMRQPVVDSRGPAKPPCKRQAGIGGHAVVDRLVGVADLEQLQQRGAQIGDRLFSRSAIADRSNARTEQAEARQTPSSSCSTT